MNIPPWIIILTGYLLGSLPSAYIAGRLLRGVDIRTLGDANSGAANTYHTLGAKAGLAVFIADASKGALVVLLAQGIAASQLTVLAAGLAAVVGHNWPFFLGFRGGRGVSTTIGAFLIVLTIPMVWLAIPAVITLLVRKSTTYTSSVIFVPLPFLCWWFGYSGLLVAYSLSLPCLIGITHYLRTRRLARHA